MAKFIDYVPKILAMIKIALRNSIPFMKEILARI